MLFREQNARIDPCCLYMSRDVDATPTANLRGTTQRAVWEAGHSAASAHLVWPEYGEYGMAIGV